MTDKPTDTSSSGTKARTIAVLAEVPVLGMKRGAIATLTDSEYLQRVIAQGHLTRVRKADGEDPDPLSDAGQVPVAELHRETAAAADALEAAASAGGDR